MSGKDGLRNGMAWAGAVVAVTLFVANCCTRVDASQAMMMRKRFGSWKCGQEHDLQGRKDYDPGPRVDGVARRQSRIAAQACASITLQGGGGD